MYIFFLSFWSQVWSEVSKITSCDMAHAASVVYQILCIFSCNVNVSNISGNLLVEK